MDKKYFTANRDRLMGMLKDESMVILGSNQLLYGNEDEVLPFKQGSDFLYLTGIEQAESKLIIFKNSYCHSEKEVILYLKENTPLENLWHGEKLSFSKAESISGIKNIKPLSAYEADLHHYGSKSKFLYLNANEHSRDSSANYHFKTLIKEIMNLFPLHSYLRLAPILQSLRTIKSPLEIELLKKSIAITKKGILKILPLIKAGINERDIEAELARCFIKHSTKQTHECFAFTPIIASGAKTCILHYTENNQTLAENDLLMLDVGARYRFFNADITRTFPINGYFDTRQKEIYQKLLEAQKQIIALLRPNLSFKDYKNESLAIMQEALKSLKLIKTKEDYKRYFMHQVSHFLGIGVHDVGDYEGELKTGMVLTCEPGIYIKEENLGMRLEDDVLITENGSKNLSEAIPKGINEIEALMNAR